VETFSLKSRDLRLMDADILVAQMKADAREALGYYGEKLDIRRPSLKHLAPEGSTVRVQRVRLIYEGGELMPKNPDWFKAAREEAQRTVKGVEVSSQ
jgi:hypothetical protein